MSKLTKEQRAMSETKLEVTQRKIRNGLRKQAEAVQKEKEKVWDILKTDHTEPKFGTARFDSAKFALYTIGPLIIGNGAIDWETTA